MTPWNRHILILEGPDGAGKTMLANQLAMHFGLRVHHEGPPPLDIPPLKYYSDILNLARLEEPGVIFDRFALGERVYGPIFRGTNRFNDKAWHTFSHLITAVCAFQIMCLPSYEVCRNHWASGRPEMIRDEATFRQTYERFAALGSLPGQYHYDWTRSPLGLDPLLEAIAKHQRNCRVTT